MNSPQLSNELRRLIHSIQSISHLEALLLLHQNPSTLWQPDSLASRLYVTPEVAGNILLDLEATGMAKRRSPPQEAFFFGPTNPDLHTQVSQLAHYYSHHLIEVTNMIHSRTNQASRVRQFADAFKFHKKDE